MATVSGDPAKMARYSARMLQANDDVTAQVRSSLIPALERYRKGCADFEPAALAAATPDQDVRTLMAACIGTDDRVHAVGRALEEAAGGHVVSGHVLSASDTAVNAALAALTAIDTRVLQKYVNEQGRGQGDPAGVARWWSELSLDEQKHLEAADPQLLGWLDGLPADTRDHANRILLGEKIKQLKQQVSSLNRESLAARTFELAQLQSLGAELSACEQLQAVLDNGDRAYKNHKGPYVYLLGFDPFGQGRAVVAYGNPDVAEHTAVFVPGVGGSLSSVGGDTGDAAQAKLLYDKVHGEPGGGSESVILWIGYHPPPKPGVDLGQDAQLLARVWRTDDAVAGAPALDSFLAGLRAGHQGQPSEVTVIGHSYGSLLVGEAAKRVPRFPADNIIFIGSPGVGVQNASELHVPAGHVYVGANILDIARDSSDLGGLPSDLLSRTRQGIFGADPSDPRFGAKRFSTGEDLGAGGVGSAPFHDYFFQNPIAARNMAHIVAGNLNEITPGDPERKLLDELTSDISQMPPKSPMLPYDSK